MVWKHREGTFFPERKDKRFQAYGGISPGPLIVRKILKSKERNHMGRLSERDSSSLSDMDLIN